MCGMNLAFDRKLIGPAMYFGLMGQGQPWGRYDDMWAGWCSKVQIVFCLPAPQTLLSKSQICRPADSIISLPLATLHSVQAALRVRERLCSRLESFATSELMSALPAPRGRGSLREH